MYNAEKYLNKCIESIVNQSYKNLEIIIVNDGSVDGSIQICREWSERDNRITIIDKENGGVSSARNAGLDAATGDLISFVDSDDWIDEHMYERMISFIFSTDSQIASCAITRENPDGTSSIWGGVNEEYCLKSREDVLIEISSTLGLVCIHTCNKVFKKEILSNVRFDESLTYCEDVLFNYIAALKSKKIVYLNYAYYHFYYNIFSATHNRKEYAKFDTLRVQDKLYELSPEELHQYCVRGDILKTLDKIKEVLTDGVCSNKEYHWLRKRVTSHFNEIIKSRIYTKITKLKVIVLTFLPLTFKILNIIYGRRQIRK